MAFVQADRVFETTTTTGAGTVDLGGAVTGGYQTFVAGVGNANTCHYCIVDSVNSEWEVGIGTVTDAATDTLSRDTILASSNGGSAVNLNSGTKDVFCVRPSDGTQLTFSNGKGLISDAGAVIKTDAGGNTWTVQSNNSAAITLDIKTNAGTSLIHLADGDGGSGWVSNIQNSSNTVTLLRVDHTNEIITFDADIKADFSSSIGTRNKIQTSTTNGNTLVPIMPDGTGTQAYVEVFGSSSTLNAALGRLGHDGTNLNITSSKIGTGVIGPILFRLGSTTALTIEADGTLSVPAATNYETLVTADDDIPNKKYVDDAVTAGGGINNVVEDTTPQLGGNLDVNDFSIVGKPSAGASSPGGDISVTAADGGATTGDGGDLNLSAGAGQNIGGAVTINGGNNTNDVGGYIILRPGDSVDSGSSQVRIAAKTGNESATLAFLEAPANGSNYVALRAPASVTTNRSWTLPQDDPTTANGKFMKAGANGALSFAAVVENPLTANLDMGGFYIYEDANPGTQNADLGSFYGKWNGTDVAYMQFQSGSDTVNKDSGQIAFYTYTASATVSQALLIDESQRLIINGSDLIGASAGSLTVSTGNSGVASANVSADDLLIESSGNAGITIASGTTSGGYLLFGDSGDNDIGGFRYNHNEDKLYILTGAGERIDINQNGLTTITCNNQTPLRTKRQSVGVSAGITTNTIFESDESTAGTNVTQLYIRQDATNDISYINTGATGNLVIGKAIDGTGGSVLFNGTNIVLGAIASDALGVDSGSLTISTGNSGASSVGTNADDFIIESAGNTGMTILSPNTSQGNIRFGDPEGGSQGQVKYFHSTDELQIVTGGALRAKFDANGLTISTAGIKLDNLGSSDINTLDDYEEGTWTAVVADAASGGNTASIGSQSCRYTKVGRVVHITGFIQNVTTTSMTGTNDIFIRGLPFTNVTGVSAIGNVQMADVAFTGLQHLCVAVPSATAYVKINETASGGAIDSLTVDQITSGSGDFYFSVSYEAA